MTEALFLATAEKEQDLKEQGEHRLNVSGVLKILGVSRSGYRNWKNRLPSEREQRKRVIKEGFPGNNINAFLSCKKIKKHV